LPCSKIQDCHRIDPNHTKGTHDKEKKFNTTEFTKICHFEICNGAARLEFTLKLGGDSLLRQKVSQQFTINKYAV